MSRFVRQSAYRHVFGTPAKKEKVHDNIKISGAFPELRDARGLADAET